MALLGEGDPRWLVEQRADGRNVNAWHWEERDVSNSAKDELKRRLNGVVLRDDADWHVELSSVETVTGDVSLARRKGRNLVIFDLDITVNWLGYRKADADTRCKGTVEFNIDSEDYDSPDFQVRYTENTTQLEPARQVVKDDGTKVVRQTVTTFVNELKAQAQSSNQNTSSPSITPNAPSSAQMTQSHSSATTATSALSAASASSAAAAAAAASSKPRERELNLRFEYRCAPRELYECLLDQGRMSAITQSQCTISRDVNGEFLLFGGSVRGKHIELVPGERIVQQWRSSSWPAGVFSTVRMTIEPTPNGAAVNIHQVGVPESDFERTESGWKDHVFRNFRLLYPAV